MISSKLFTASVLLLLTCSALRSSVSAQGTVQGEAEDVSPFLLVTAWNRIVKLQMNGSDPQVLVQENGGGIIAVDYHYRMNLLVYLITDWLPGLYTVPLSQERLTDSQPNKRVTLVERNMEHPIGLAVDWINNKVFWTDRNKHTLEEYDLITQQRRVLVQMENSALPQGLSLYPYPEYGWLFLMLKDQSTADRSSKLMRITTDGNQQTKMRGGICSSISTLDHREQKLFWVDECVYKIETSLLDGKEPSTVVGSIPNANNVAFSRGLAQYHKDCYVTQRNKVYHYDIDENGYLLYSVESTMTLGGIGVVHPSKQPSADELSAIGLCTPSCHNGQCISGLCACNKGWKGPTCSEDVNECETNNGNCDHLCENAEGNFQCKCRPSFFLQEDKKSCSVTPSTTSEQPAVPTTTLERPTDAQTAVTTTREIITEEPIDKVTTTKEIITEEPTDKASSSSSEAPTSATTTLNIPGTSPPSNTIKPKDSITSTTQHIIVTSSPNGEYVTSTPTPTRTLSVSTQHQKTTESTENKPTSSMPRKTISVHSRDRPQVTPFIEDGLNRVPEERSPTMVLIVIAVCIVSVLLIIVVAVSYLFLVFYKYKQRRKGSYNVRSRLRESDSVTSLPPSSFRAIMDTRRMSGETRNTVTGSTSVDSFERISIGSPSLPLVEPIRIEVSEAQLDTAVEAAPEIVHVPSGAAATAMDRQRMSGFNTLYISEQREIHFSL